MTTSDEEFEEALNIVAGGPAPAMFTPAWWKGGYGRAYVSGAFNTQTEVDEYFRNYQGYTRWVQELQERNRNTWHRNYNDRNAT